MKPEPNLVLAKFWIYQENFCFARSLQTVIIDHFHQVRIALPPLRWHTGFWNTERWGLDTPYMTNSKLGSKLSFLEAQPPKT